jgi:hypothetical protein
LDRNVGFDNNLSWARFTDYGGNDLQEMPVSDTCTEVTFTKDYVRSLVGVVDVLNCQQHRASQTSLSLFGKGFGDA